jgi:hypothetical protein
MEYCAEFWLSKRYSIDSGRLMSRDTVSKDVRATTQVVVTITSQLLKELIKYPEGKFYLLQLLMQDFFIRLSSKRRSINCTINAARSRFRLEAPSVFQPSGASPTDF